MINTPPIPKSSGASIPHKPVMQCVLHIPSIYTKLINLPLISANFIHVHSIYFRKIYVFCSIYVFCFPYFDYDAFYASCFTRTGRPCKSFKTFTFTSKDFLCNRYGLKIAKNVASTSHTSEVLSYMYVDLHAICITIVIYVCICAYKNTYTYTYLYRHLRLEGNTANEDEDRCWWTGQEKGSGVVSWVSSNQRFRRRGATEAKLGFLCLSACRTACSSICLSVCLFCIGNNLL